MKIYLIGPSGSGKTVIGKNLGTALGIRHIDTDLNISSSENVTTIAEIFSKKGEAYFRQREIELLRELASSPRSAIVSTGGGLPAVKGAMQLMLSTGFVVYLHARPKTLWHRLEFGDELRLRPLLWNKGIEQLRRLCKRRRAYYSLAHFIIETDGLGVPDSTELVLEAIKKKRKIRKV